MASTAMSIKITYGAGRRAYERRMRSAKRKLLKERKRLVRKAGKIILVEVRKDARKVKGSGRYRPKAVKKGKKGEEDSIANRKPGNLARQNKLSVRSRRGVVSATIGTKPGSIAWAYGQVLEHGGSISRRGHKATSRKGNTFQRKASTADYSRRHWFEPAVDRTEGRVFSILGQAFKVV